MKAMILAAGRGERMRPLTDTTPKPLLKVADKALIEYHLENLARAGINEVVINHAWLGEKLTESIGNGERYQLAITYSDEGKTALETAGGIVKALPLLGNEPFVVVNADIWTDFDYRKLMPPTRKIHLVLVDNPEHNPRGDFALDADGLVHNQASAETESLTYSGIGVYSPEIFTKLKAGVQPLAPILREAIASHQVSGEHYRGQWWDVGTPARLQELDSMLRNQLN
ncbi:MAG: nucleotidyltransferase family protein [Thioalkalispiraceae bacterium]|jgi:MurNAc alpha-1-phosphate uridylyltransferase